MCSRKAFSDTCIHQAVFTVNVHIVIFNCAEMISNRIFFGFIQKSPFRCPRVDQTFHSTGIKFVNETSVSRSMEAVSSASRLK